ncbi:signal transduction histidine kinase/ligand-binding sensor domain-containing protein/DNA-binding response OmpR family regulator [Wenyingzhuangia heitensis]|uniref:histidine kinase n=1 Tax=Wenyingzhuangia heitensis TaxID=1487859 RepID=A0ABX0UCB7_9FLAO|nr:two-component regulator propeller domain-containing protein [Wenyingzhuangia heitensis]NIJ46474.1 signal transduction histidine kinase/ligand-binding sensor domain-containing protein/DNA-binding response OmpR family regulator [Wenyingzhuangia heitensis]
MTLNTSFLSRIILLIFGILFFQNHTFAQTAFDKLEDLRFKHLSIKEGLSQRSVTSIIQDSKGYLWFGTRDGLNMFDGTDVIVFRHNSEDTTSLSHSWVTSVFEDSNRNIWVGTTDGLNLYNPKERNFIRYQKNHPNNFLTDNNVWNIAQVDDKTLWITTNKNITLVDVENKKSKALPKDIGNKIKFNQIRAAYKTKDGFIWLCTPKKIIKYNLDLHKVELYQYPNDSNSEPHHNNAPKIYQDTRNKIWLGYENGLATWDAKQHKFVDAPYNITSPVRTFNEDVDGNLWIGSYTGLYILNSQRTKVKQFVNDPNRLGSLSQNSIYNITRDNRGDMWIGTWAGGVNHFDYNFQTFKQIAYGTSHKMLNYSVVSSIIELDNGNLFVGTEGGGLNYYNKSKDAFTYYKYNSKNPNSLGSNNIKALLLDKHHQLWIGTHDKGLFYTNIQKKPFLFNKVNPILSDGTYLEECRILSLYQDEQQNIWIGTLAKGLFVYNTTNKTIKKISNYLNSIKCISKSDKANEILIGGLGGVEKINTLTHKVTFLNNENSKTFIPKSVNCILVHQKKIWIGTEGKGLYKVDVTKNITTKFSIAEGLLSEVIYGIISGNDGKIWMSTNSGISSLTIEGNEIENYLEPDGLQGREFNYGAYSKGKNGVLMFGGTNGLNIFNPKEIIKNNFVPPVDIYGININNKNYINITNPNFKIDLKHNQNDIQVDYTALSFSQAEKNQFAYKLEGFDTEWKYVGQNKRATYTNLDSGTYTFKVKAANSNNLWNVTGKNIQLTILPAPWKTWWAYTIYTLLLFTLLLFIQRIIIIRIKERNELKQEKLDKERLEEINQLKLTMFTNISHDFRTPLTLIIGPLQRMIKNNLGNIEIQKQHKIMHTNANMLLELINQLLDFRKSESGKLQLYASESNIVDFVKTIKKAFDELASFKQYSFDFYSEQENISLWFDQIKMKKILYNLLSNAFKYNEEHGKIAIKIGFEDEKFKKYVTIKIINYGEVIPSQNLDSIFDRFYRFDKEGKQKGTGIGLALTKNLVELHYGKITATSSKQDGTCFKVMVPLGKKHLREEERIAHKVANIDIEKSFLLEKNLKTQEQESLQQEEHINPNKQTILVVEDNIEVRNFVKEIFEHNYNIVEAENGKIGLEILKKTNPELVISDVMMPEMDGFELCENIKKNILTSHIPVILLTAKTAIEHQKTGFTTGADAYISKPFDAAILEIRVQNILNTRKNLISKFKKEIILEPKEMVSTSADEEFLKKAIDIIEENLHDNNFNVNQFTQKMNMSRSVVYRKTKALTDQSITEFIRTIKLKKAAQMLVKTPMSISEIAYEIGFSDLKYFRSCFKKQFNDVPSAYRSKNAENKTN